ncbi:MAG: hypothetical protein JXB39_00130 [Deltaproteobacteria bacterium]|nr:hypothetical protein [Deltaproteobacteria bacterium]
MRTFFVVVLPLLAACESVEPRGGLFEPAEDASAAVRAPPPDWQFPSTEPVTIRSEELGQGAGTVTVNPAEPASATLPPADLTEPAADAAEDVPVDVPPVAAPAAPPPPPPAIPDPGVTDTWPVRLVATVPDAQPPRAILGLADGREVVVKPGTLLPEPHLVVMAVGAHTVELAEVRPMGDHADVVTRTLHAQR